MYAHVGFLVGFSKTGRKNRVFNLEKTELFAKEKALFSEENRTFLHGAVTRIRTGDLILTKDALYLLSYNSIFDSFDIIARFSGTVNCFFSFLVTFFRGAARCRRIRCAGAKAGAIKSLETP